MQIFGRYHGQRRSCGRQFGVGCDRRNHGRPEIVVVMRVVATHEDLGQTQPAFWPNILYIRDLLGSLDSCAIMTDQLRITATYIPHLRSAFSRANVVLFTGAGFSRDGVNVSGKNVPQVGDLVKSLWNICYPGHQFDPSTQLQDVYEAAIQVNRNATAQLMRESFTVHAQKCPDYYGRLLAMPWNQVYTLNVDDLQEKLLELHQPGRTIRSVSATTDRITNVDPGALNVIHINGALRDVPDKVTFSRAQYAVRRIGDPFYDILRKDLVSRPVVFIGTSLEEGPNGNTW